MILKSANFRKHVKICLSFLTLMSIFCTAVCVYILFFNNKDTKLSSKEIFNNNLNSIVEIKAYSENIGESFGTAEFVNSEGLLVTNAHVVTYSSLQIINEFEHYYIRFASDIDYIEVQLIKYDIYLDIAVLKMDANLHIFKSMSISNSSTVYTGDKVYAIGNSANYGLSMSEGIIGVPSLNIEHNETTRNVIQASINIVEGNSGGALLNDRGELIGITTFRTKDDAENVIYGIAYCIPINTVLEYINNN